MAALFLPSTTDLPNQIGSHNTGESHEADNLLLTLVSQTQLLAGLYWLNKAQVLACIPPGETVAFQNVAEMACVSVSELIRVVRFTAISGFLCEPRTDFVAHTELSRHYLLRTALSDAVMFFGDTVFAMTLNTPLTPQLQSTVLHRRNSTFPNPSSLQLDGRDHQPRLKRQATAFQRQVIHQALSSESSSADLLELWMADASSDNFTVVQVCCESDATARLIARRHPQLYFVIQLTVKTELSCENSNDGANMGHITVQDCAPMSTQRVTDAWLYIIHLPTPSILATSPDILSQATQMLWAHFNILRQNRFSRLVLVANGLIGATNTNHKAEAAARMYDVLLLQMTVDKHAVTINQMEQMLSSIRDASWRLVIWTKEISESHPIVAFEVGLAAI